MASESVIWTLLPSGVDPDTGDLRSTIFVSPRLRTGGGTCHLPEFPVFRHWAQAVTELTFIAEIDGLGGIELVPDPHRIGPPDPAMWDLLFGDPGITVEEPIVRNLNSRRVFSFPADAVASSVLSLYTEVGATHPTEHPSVLDPLLAGLAADLGRIGDDSGGRGIYYGLDGLFGADPTRGDRPGRFIPQQMVAGNRQRSFMLANRFYDRYEGTERLRDRRGPIDSSAVPPPPDRPSLDFHRYVAALGDYPELLRRLGLAIDVRMQAHPDIAKHQRYRLMVGGDAPAWMNADTASPWMNYLWDGKFFLPRTRPEGRHDVADGQLTLDNADFYTVHQIDIDGSALKTTHVAGTISRRITLVQSKNGATMAPTTSSLPALRGGGLTIIRRNAAAAVVNQFDRTATLDDNEKKGQQPVLWADDVIRGFRYEAERDGDGRFRSLVDRVGTYRYHQSDGTIVPLDLARDQGYVKGSSTTSVPEDKNNPEPDLYLHEAVASWSGWSMVAPRPGGGVNRTDQVKEEPALVRDANIPLETAFTVTPGSLPRLRYGSSYRLRARTVDLAGNSVDLRTIDDRHASPPAVFKRWEPVPAPAVVPRRMKLDTNGNPVLDKSGHVIPVHTEGESQMRLVVRSTAGMTVAEYVALDRVTALVDPVHNPTHLAYLATDDRWIVAPKTSQQMAEWHGMFDEAIGSGDPTLIQQAFDIACRSTEELPPAEPATTCSIPYLPDVSSRGVLFNRFPADPAVYRRVEWPTDSGAWWDRQPFRIVLADGPAAAPVTPAGNPVPPVWNPADRTLTVHLPQADMVTVRLSSAVEQGDLDIQGMYARIVGHNPAEANARRQEAMQSRNWMLTPWVELTFVHAVEKPLADPTVAVYNAGMVRNANETFCVLQGAITNHAKSTGRLDIEAEWTEQADDIGEDVPADGVNGGDVRKLHSHVGDFLIEAFEDSALVGRDDVTTETGKGNTHLLRHEFGNTRHRTVEYRARATTRFREYFPTQITEGVDKTNQPLIRREGPPTSLIVPSSRRPDPPDIAYIIPTFHWTEDLVPLPSGGGPRQGLKLKFARRRTRHGGGLRVYLRRPWYSSGDGEQLGVVLQDQPWLTYPVDRHAGMTITDADQLRVDGFLAAATRRGHVKLDGSQSAPIAERFLRGIGVSDAQIAGNDKIVLRGGQFAGFTNLSALLSQVDLASLLGGNIETWLTKVGTDPAFASHVVPADGPYIHQLPLRASVRGGLTPFESPSETVTVVGHTPKFDAARKLWYCDIELDPDQAYQPFVRLALCRYQPHSIEGCHMSRIVRADFAQLLPERVAALTPLGDNRSAITLRGPAGMGWLGTTKLVGMGLTRSVTATVQRLDAGKDPDLDWADVNSPVELKYALTPTVPADVTWSAMLPGFVRQDGSSYRVLLQEFEFHRADETATPHPFDGKESWTNDEFPRKYWVGRRLVYADTFSL